MKSSQFTEIRDLLISGYLCQAKKFPDSSVLLPCYCLFFPLNILSPSDFSFLWRKVIANHYFQSQITDAQWSLFSLKSRTSGLGQTIWADKFWGIWGIFSRFISTHFGTVSPLSIFFINQPLSLQKTRPLYQNPKYWFECGPQRIRDLGSCVRSPCFQWSKMWCY